MAITRWPVLPTAPGLPGRSRPWRDRCTGGRRGACRCRRLDGESRCPQVPLSGGHAPGGAGAAHATARTYRPGRDHRGEPADGGVLGGAGAWPPSVGRGVTPAQAGLFVLTVVAASASWRFLLVSGGALIGRVAASDRACLPPLSPPACSSAVSRSASLPDDPSWATLSLATSEVSSVLERDRLWGTSAGAGPSRPLRGMCGCIGHSLGAASPALGHLFDVIFSSASAA
jgi:hypothetical protein